MTLTSAQRQLLTLVQLSLRDPENTSLHRCSLRSHPSDPFDWQALYPLAEQHAVIALVSQAIDRLPSDLWPARLERLKWHGYASRIAGVNAAVNADLQQLVRCLDGGGVPYVVCKGQVLASLYPEPSRRNSGDVDFYVPAAHYQRARQLLTQQLGICIERAAEADKHEDFTLGATHFEMHFRLETFGTRRHQQLFDAMIDRCLLSPSATRQVRRVDQYMVPVLPPVEEVVMTFKHLFNHLLMEGVGLRQLFDMRLLVEHFCTLGSEVADPEQLQQQLDAVGYLPAFRALLATLHRHLGLTRLPFELSAADYRWADALIGVTFSHGSFGKYNRTSATHRPLRQLDTATLALRHCLRFMPLAPTDILGLLPTRLGIALKRCSRQSH